MSEKKPIPEIIIGRLPVYLRALEHMQNRGMHTTSSQQLGEMLGISAAQIRKDLSQFGEFGKQGTGYNIAYLVARLREILNITGVWGLAIVGMGDMGHALARYSGFKNRGFCIEMVFDNDPAKIGQRVSDFIIQDTAEMAKRLSEAGIRIAMLCVPAPAAQAVANELVKAGVTAILNYAPINLTLPAHVHVQYIDPVIGLQRMAYHLK